MLIFAHNWRVMNTCNSVLHSVNFGQIQKNWRGIKVSTFPCERQDKKEHCWNCRQAILCIKNKLQKGTNLRAWPPCRDANRGPVPWLLKAKWFCNSLVFAKRSYFQRLLTRSLLVGGFNSSQKKKIVLKKRPTPHHLSQKKIIVY